jgi:hypothetical protein
VSESWQEAKKWSCCGTEQQSRDHNQRPPNPRGVILHSGLEKAGISGILAPEVDDEDTGITT